MADRTLIPANPEIWRRTGAAVPQCTSDCHQGRAECPCPEACELPDETDPAMRATVWRVYLVIVVAALGAIFWPY